MSTRTLFLVLMVVALCGTVVLAQIPRTISYQGVLSDTAGYPKKDSTYSMTFRLYETPAGGTSIWAETKNLATRRGLFSTQLGDVTPFSAPGSVSADGAESPQSTAAITFGKQYWLGIQVGSDPELSPRTPLSTVPYSMTAIKADTAAYSLSGVGGSSLWSTNGSNIYYNSGSVGVGTTNPDTKLDVAGFIRSSAQSDQIQLQSYDQVGKTWRLGTYIGATGPARDFTIWESDLGNALTIKQSNGNVGIGTTTPRGILDVIGSPAAENRTAASLFLKTGNATNDGGDFVFHTGVGTSWPTGGGNFNFTAADGSLGGSFNLTAGAGSDFNGGSFNMTAGNSAGGIGGGFTSTAGNGVQGGGILLRSGNGSSSAGNIELRGGTSGGGPGGNIIFRPGGGLGGAVGYANFLSGSVGIGTPSTPTAKLDVVGTAKATTLVSTGKTGIGTTTPQALLHVAGDTTRNGNGDSILIFAAGKMGNGGKIRLRAGDGEGNGGGIDVTAGDGRSFGGGHMSFTCGDAIGAGGSGDGGGFLFQAGSAGVGKGGGFIFMGGDVTGDFSPHPGGGFSFFGGRTRGHGGDFTVEAGVGDASGGDISLKAGNGGGALGPPLGGNINFTTGNGTAGAGSFTFTPGAGPGGTYGNFRILNLAVGGGTTLVIDNDGNLRKQSSSLRFKNNVTNLPVNLEAVLKLRPVSFTWKSTGAGDIGLIAEEVEQQIADLVIHGSDGKPEGVKYDRLALYLLELLKEQKKEISLLRQRLDRIEQNTGR